MEYQRVYCYGAVALEYVRDGGEDFIPYDHVLALPYIFCKRHLGWRTLIENTQSFVPLGVFN